MSYASYIEPEVEKKISNKGRRRIKAKLKELGIKDEISNPQTQVCKDLIKEEEAKWKKNKVLAEGFLLLKKALELYPVFKELVLKDLDLIKKIELSLKESFLGFAYAEKQEGARSVLFILQASFELSLDELQKMQEASKLSPRDKRFVEMIEEIYASKKVKDENQRECSDANSNFE